MKNILIIMKKIELKHKKNKELNILNNELIKEKK